MLSGIVALLGGSSLFGLATGNLTLKNVASWSILLAVGVIVVSLGTVYIRILGVRTTNPSEHERDIYAFVASLPKDAVLAGDPDIMTNIPLFSKRSVLFRDLFPKTNAPIVEYFDAQYAETPQTTLNFCQRYQISYLVLDTRDFARLPGQGGLFLSTLERQDCGNGRRSVQLCFVSTSVGFCQWLIYGHYM
jgi:hypothetical protein